MRFHETPLRGAYWIELEPALDERGFFARSFCREEFAAHGLQHDFSQAGVSLSRRAGTLRGLHFQAPPHAEAKLIRCTRGRVYDVIVDLRPDSETRFQWWAIELSAENRHQLYVPEGFAQGFQTLEDESELSYQMSVPYAPEAVAGYHYASPAFGIQWPLPVCCLSERDAKLESLSGS